MAVINVSNELEILTKYRSLVKASLDGESVYIRTKETLMDLFENRDFTSREKSEILSQVLGSLNSTVVSTAMGTAMQWASEEKSVELKKLELEKSLAIMEQDALLKELQRTATLRESVDRQASTIRNYGTPTVVDGVVTALTDTGKVYEDTRLTVQQVTNAGKEGDILAVKEKEAQAMVHKIVADTYVNYGRYTYTLDSTGLTSVTDITPPTHTTLSDTQQSIAAQQAKGYAYNAWANAVSGASSTLGTAMASEYPIFDPGEPGAQLLSSVLTAVDNLKNVATP